MQKEIDRDKSKENREEVKETPQDEMGAIDFEWSEDDDVQLPPNILISLAG